MRIAFYFTQHESLGHTTRVMTLLKALKQQLKEDIDFLILHSGRKQPLANLEKYGNVINLPYSIGKEYFYKNQLAARLLQMNGNDVLLKRVRIMKKALKNFNPDILITEYFPMGKEVWHLEIPIVLKFAKESLSAKTISSVGYPSCEDESYEMVRDLYDMVLFHCSKIDSDAYVSTLEGKNLNPERFLKIMEDFGDKIEFTGYLLDKNRKDLISLGKVKDSLGIPAGHKLVVVSRGGGVVYPKIILSSFLARKMIKEDSVHFLVSLGPSTEGNKIRLYSKISRKLKNIKLVKYLPEFENYLNASDISINMAGYNTMVRLLWLKKQNICIPSKSVEQEYKASLLKNFNIADIIRYESLSGDVLKDAIIKRLEEPLKASKKIDELSFRGAEKTVKLIEGI